MIRILVYITLYTLAFIVSTVQSYSQVNKANKITIETGSTRFFVVGDWGRNGERGQQEVADEMGKLGNVIEPQFVISVGDNFYCCGVASTEDPQWKSSYEDVYKAHSLNIPWFVVLGNHDYYGNPQAQIDYSKVSRRWRMPSRYYTVGMKDVRFVFIDTNPFVKKHYKRPGEYADIAQQDTTRQLLWLDSVLANSTEKWKIVVGHHPVYSTGSKHGNTVEMIHTLKPILEKNKVQVYLSGHDHDLQHQLPVDSKVHYFISGAGSETRPTYPDKRMTKFAAAVSGFLVVSVKDEKMHFYFVDSKGNVVYQASLSLN